MKNIIYAFAALPFLALAQTDANLASNGSFEAVTKKIMAPGLACEALGISSANLTTVDIFSKNASCGSTVKVPNNYMGNRTPSTGDNYAGIIAYYGDESGIIRDLPGYDSYTEYLQVELTQPLVAGKTYNVKLKISLADKSAYAVSGLGIVMSKEKFAVDNNSYLLIEPDMVSMNIAKDKEWETIEGVYTAEGGEQYLIFGTFAEYMVVEKVIPDFTNNSRKAYYYIDDISVTPSGVANPSKDLAFTDGCFKLKNLNFETSKATILPESFKELDALASFLKKYPTLTVYVDGYTDKTGTANINEKLSEDRANAVKTYLVNKGVTDSNLLTRWHGSQSPIDRTANNSMTNRRVEITACCFK
ncbi:MAG: OmpA family protein [Bacteroidia bacterium]